MNGFNKEMELNNGEIDQSAEIDKGENPTPLTINAHKDNANVSIGDSNAVIDVTIDYTIYADDDLFQALKEMNYADLEYDQEDPWDDALREHIIIKERRIASEKLQQCIDAAARQLLFGQNLLAPTKENPNDNVKQTIGKTFSNVSFRRRAHSHVDGGIGGDGEVRLERCNSESQRSGVQWGKNGWKRASATAARKWSSFTKGSASLKDRMHNLSLKA